MKPTNPATKNQGIPRSCDTCWMRDGGDRCLGCYHAPEQGFSAPPGLPNWTPHPDATPTATEEPQS